MLCILYPLFLYIVRMQGWRTTAACIYKMLNYIVWWLPEWQYSFYLFSPLWIDIRVAGSHIIDNLYLIMPFVCPLTSIILLGKYIIRCLIHDKKLIVYAYAWCFSHETHIMRLFHHSSPKGIYNFIKIFRIVTQWQWSDYHRC